MAYSTLDDITNDIGEKTLIELSNDTNSATTINEALVLEYISSADAEIDSYFLGSYSTPLTNADDLILINPISIALVTVRLYKRRFKINTPISIINRENDAIADLIKVRTGIISLHTATKDNLPNRYRSTGNVGYFKDLDMF